MPELDLAETVAQELEELETMRAAMLTVTRDSLEWPELRRAILKQGGIGPSRDWSRDAYPADLFRVHGKAPDLVAADVVLGTADRPPWASVADDTSPSDVAMFGYLHRAYDEWRAYQQQRADATRRRLAPMPAPSTTRTKTGTRSFADLVRELRAKHGTDVDLSGLRSEYVSAYESGERIDVEHDGRTWRGTVGATRGPVPRFVLLVSLPL